MIARDPATSSPSSRGELECVCPADIVLDALGSRWATCIIKRIGQHGTLHFGALKRTIPGISKKVLSARLHGLERAGILRRELRPLARPEIHYSFTRRGRELKKVLDGLQKLGARWQREDTDKSRAA